MTTYEIDLRPTASAATRCNPSRSLTLVRGAIAQVGVFIFSLALWVPGLQLAVAGAHLLFAPPAAASVGHTPAQNAAYARLVRANAIRLSQAETTHKVS